MDSKGPSLWVITHNLACLDTSESILLGFKMTNFVGRNYETPQIESRNA